jgi:peptide/nickel transport system substrate-binding protein
LSAIGQHAFVEAIVGEQSELGRTSVGYSTEGQPMATDVGLEALTGPRDLALARKLVAEAGCKGEPVLMIGPVTGRRSIRSPR